jgi:HEAT repeat protein
MTSALDRLLALLQDESAEFPAGDLVALSDLGRVARAALQEAWPGIADDRRIRLIEETGQMADAQLELDFDFLNRLALQDPDETVRACAIRNLWESEDPKLAPAFLSALRQDPSARVRQAAATALGAFILLGELERLDPQALQSLEDGLIHSVGHDSDSPVRRAAVESLGYSSRPEVGALIRQAASQDDELWQASALAAMGRTADAEWASAVVPRLNEPSPLIRARAARACGALELSAAAADLIDLLEDISPDVRLAAIWSLGQVSGKAARLSLQRMQRQSSEALEIESIEEALEHMAFLDGGLDLLVLGEGEGEDEAPLS